MILRSTVTVDAKAYIFQLKPKILDTNYSSAGEKIRYYACIATDC